MKKLLFATAIILATVLTACEQKKDGPVENANATNEKMMDSTNQTKMEDDAEFAVAAADGGMMEVKASEMAQTKATSQAVKDFAAMMIKDHGAANTELKGIADGQKITLPDAMGMDHQKKFDDLAAKTGVDFDKAYISAMQDGHDATISKFENEIKDGKNMAVKAFAEKTLPTLKMHKEKIDAIKDAMK